MSDATPSEEHAKAALKRITKTRLLIPSPVGWTSVQVLLELSREFAAAEAAQKRRDVAWLRKQAGFVSWEVLADKLERNDV